MRRLMKKHDNAPVQNTEQKKLAFLTRKKGSGEIKQKNPFKVFNCAF